MRRMMKNADIEYVGKLQKGTKVYVYPPVIGEDGFYISYDAELTVKYLEENPDYVDFESHTLRGYIQYSSPLLEENDVILDLDAFVDTQFPETINTYQDLANWIGENLSELNIEIESLGLKGADNSYIYEGQYELKNNQIYFPDGIEEKNGGETFVSIPDMLVQNIQGYEDQEINIQSVVKINDHLKVNNISPVRGTYVRIDRLFTSHLDITEITSTGTLKISSLTGVLIQKLPTSDPGVKDSIWNDNGTLKISAGE